MLRRLEQIDPADPDVGGKAQGLARMRAAGLPVPPTVVVGVAAFRAALAAAGGPPAEGADEAALDALAARLRAAPLDPALAADLDGAAAAIGGPLAVRSSATSEDRAAALAPGLYESRVGVAPGAALHDAVREVWSSLYRPAAAAYLAARRLRLADAAMAVLIQPALRGPAGTAYTRAPGDDAAPAILVEVAATGATPGIGVVDRATGAPLAVPAPLDAAELVAVAEAALRAEAALGGPADVEWILAGPRTLVLLQARPVAAPPARGPDPFGDAARELAATAPEAVWTWDAAHNPDPLSAAQEGLVALVDDAGAATIRQRVVLGYLFTTPHGASPPARAIAPADLRRVFDEELRPAMERALAPLDAEAPELEAALAAYVAFYRLYAGELSPAVAHARAALLGILQQGGLGARRAAATVGRLTTGVGLPGFGARVPFAWDVASPSVSTLPVAVAPAPAPATPALSGDAALDAAARAALPIARAAAALAEEDDLYFARAQEGVRRALAALGRAWDVALDDLCHVPLADVRAAAAAGAPPARLAERAAAARAERARRRTLAPPLYLVAGRAVRLPRAAPPGALRGRGTGGRARGRVVRLGDAPPAAERLGAGDAILVCATVLPTMAPLLARCAGVVAEHGGLLGHGAALARELGLPCVVGCTGALASLADGDAVWLDADGGLVVRLMRVT